MRSFASHSFSALCGTFFGAAIVSSLGSAAGGSAALAQEFPICPPPAEGEYLLLAIVDDADDRETAIESLDGEYPAQTCLYLDEIVIRVSGFTDSSEASDLALAFTENLGLSAFVTRLPEDETNAARPIEPRPYGQALELPDVQVVDARPAADADPDAAIEPDADPNPDADAEELPVFTPEDLPPPQIAREPVAATTDSADSAPTAGRAPRTDDVRGDRVPPPSGTIGRAPNAGRPAFQDDGQIRTPFDPQPLADGYVVLVDYFNDPSVAADVAAVTGQAVGLVSYGRRPFLMADFTTQEGEANATLEALSDAGLWPLVADSQRAILLTPRVRLDR